MWTCNQRVALFLHATRCTDCLQTPQTLVHHADCRAVWQLGWFFSVVCRDEGQWSRWKFGWGQLFCLDEAGKQSTTGLWYRRLHWLTLVWFSFLCFVCLLFFELKEMWKLGRSTVSTQHILTGPATQQQQQQIWCTGDEELVLELPARQKHPRSRESRAAHGTTEHSHLTRQQEEQKKNNREGNVTGLFRWTTSLFLLCLYSFFSDKQDVLCTTLVLIHFGFVPTFVVFWL